MRRHIEHHVETLKGKPEHVRHKVAVGAAGAVTALVALVWFGGHIARGTFALNSAPPPEDDTSGFADTRENFSQLLGAVGSAVGATSTEPGMQVVDGQTTSTIQPAAANRSGDTVISF